MTQERVTISINSNTIKKLRVLQSKRIARADYSVSLSKVIDEVLTEALK